MEEVSSEDGCPDYSDKIQVEATPTASQRPIIKKQGTEKQIRINKVKINMDTRNESNTSCPNTETNRQVQRNIITEEVDGEAEQDQKDATTSQIRIKDSNIRINPKNIKYQERLELEKHQSDPPMIALP